MTSRGHKALLLMICLLGCGTAARAGDPVVGAANPDTLFHSRDRKLDANKAVVHRLMREVVESGREELASRYLAPGYIEHDPTVASGHLLSVAPARTRVARRLRTPVVAVVAEGDLVVVAKPREIRTVDGKRYTTTWLDMWRVADGKVAEHWSVATLADGKAEPGPAAGTAASSNPDALFHSADAKLDAHKQVAYHFIKDIVEAGRWAELGPVYATERYIQHNPNVPTGREGTIKLFTETLKFPVLPIAERLKMPITAVVAEGDYVAVVLPRPVVDPRNSGRKFMTTWIDLWRFQGGKADEHWDPSLLGERF